MDTSVCLVFRQQDTTGSTLDEGMAVAFKCNFSCCMMCGNSWKTNRISGGPEKVSHALAIARHVNRIKCEQKKTSIRKYHQQNSTFVVE